jgi:hypothetical protein
LANEEDLETNSLVLSRVVNFSEDLVEEIDEPFSSDPSILELTQGIKSRKHKKKEKEVRLSVRRSTRIKNLHKTK